MGKRGMLKQEPSPIAPPPDRKPPALVITPERFFDLFLLCLSWQWAGKDDLARGYTTVDKVARILFGLGIISEPQRKHLFRDRKAQQLFMRHLEFQLLSDRPDVESPKSFLVARLENTGGVNRDRLLRDVRLYLTVKGAERALGLQEKYASVITDAVYFAEIRRQEALLNGVPMAPLMEKYRERVRTEAGGLGDEE